MSASTSPIQNVPTSIITGFLGVGKTSTILHLLKTKPADERWAILVNEFGEIGVDGSLFQGQQTEENGVFIREVPGGCMCCTAGLPMQIALSQLLSRSRPDRLLIEPTGLGHPREVLEILSAEHYQGILTIEKIVTLVDARKLADSRYTQHDTFNQQIAIADIIVGNKHDLYQEYDREALQEYASTHAEAGAQVVFSEHGAIDPEWLRGPTMQATNASQHHHHSSDKISLTDAPLPESGYLRANNEGEGFKSVGWRIDSNKIFNRERLFAFLSGLQVERMKAVFITEAGIFGYNLTRDALSEFELDDCIESRIEIIAQNIDDDWEKQLLACSTSAQ